MEVVKLALCLLIYLGNYLVHSQGRQYAFIRSEYDLLGLSRTTYLCSSPSFSFHIDYIPATVRAVVQGPPSGAQLRTADCWPASAPPWSSLEPPGTLEEHFEYSFV